MSADSFQTAFLGSSEIVYTHHSRLTTTKTLDNKKCIGYTEQCPCGTGSQTTISTAVLPHLRATQIGNLARPHSRSLQAVRKSEGPAMHCHLHRGDWSFHLTNEKNIRNVRGFFLTASPRRTSGRGFRLNSGRPGLDSRFSRRFFSGSSHTSDLTIGNAMATLPGAWR